MAYPEEVYAQLIAAPDALLAKMASYSEPPVKAAA